MSHPEQTQYVASVKNSFPQYFSDCKVLEVGSYNINGSVREFFKNCDYTGIDLVAGPDVDVIASGDEYMQDQCDVFDMVISCEMFEHNPKWKETFLNMFNLLKPGGMLLFTCASTGRREHGTKRSYSEASPSCEFFGDYYMNLTEDDFHSILDFDEMFSEYQFSVLTPRNGAEFDNAGHSDLQFFGVKA